MGKKASSLFLGTFNSEFFWGDRKFVTLPSVFDPQIDAIISAMDEFQVAFCKQATDVLITKYPLDTAFKDYFHDLGFDFSYNNIPIASNGKSEDNSSRNQNICRLLLDDSIATYIKKLTSNISIFSPYSTLPYSHDLCLLYGIQDSKPNIEIVKKVNSKIYSHNLSKLIYNNGKGMIVNSAEELNSIGRLFLNESPFLIKDQYGVSGKGNILIDGENLLESIVRYVKKQERKGKETGFVLEHLFDKQLDFSCQFEINKDGDYRILSIQQMQNNGFAFAGIESADGKFVDDLEKNGYMIQVGLIAKELYREGYFGPVCLDSMILKDGSIIPIIEINARKSMGLVNFHIDQFFQQFCVKGYLMYFSLGLKNEIMFEELLHRLDIENILFKTEYPLGILPLSANTLNINKKYIYHDDSQERFNGRFYFSVVTQTINEREKLIIHLKNIFSEFNSIVLN